MAYQYNGYNPNQLYGQLMTDLRTIGFPAPFAAAPPPDLFRHHHPYCGETFFYGYRPNFAVDPQMPRGLAPLQRDPAFTQETAFFHNSPAGAAAAAHGAYDGEVAILNGFLVPTAADGEYSVAPPPQPDDGLPEGVVARFLKNAACKEAADGGGEPELCAVCQDDLCRKDEKVVALKCRHRFHGECVGRWLRMKNSCPLCKAIAIHIS